MGTNEQVMAWFMDTYSMYHGRTVTEIVTGRGVADLAQRVMGQLAIDPNNAPAVVQGYPFQ